MKTILVIDDNETFRFILSEWLREQGFYPITAADGFEGVRLAKSHRPNLIFCDINMPGMSGLEVLEQLHSQPNTSQIPFFFLTSETALQSCAMHRLEMAPVISKDAEISKIREILITVEAFHAKNP